MTNRNILFYFMVLVIMTTVLLICLSGHAQASNAQMVFSAWPVATNGLPATADPSVNDVLKLVPFKWLVPLFLGLGSALQLLVKLKDNRTMVALVKSVQAGRQYLASTQGQKTLDDFTSIMKSHQETAGIAVTIDKLLDKHVDDVVAPTPPPPPAGFAPPLVKKEPAPVSTLPGTSAVPAPVPLAPGPLAPGPVQTTASPPQ